MLNIPRFSKILFLFCSSDDNNAILATFRLLSIEPDFQVCYVYKGDAIKCLLIVDYTLTAVTAVSGSSGSPEFFIRETEKKKRTE